MSFNRVSNINKQAERNSVRKEQSGAVAFEYAAAAVAADRWGKMKPAH